MHGLKIQSLLHQAALWDNAELMEDLLNGEELDYINSQDSWGRTPLHAAATTDNSRCLRILCQTGAKIDAICGPRGEGRTALHIAAEHGHVENIRILIESGANLLVRDNLGLTPLDLADKGDHQQCMEVLQGAADRQEEARLRTFKILQDACAAGDLATVKPIIQEAENNSSASTLINFAPSGSNTLLFKASENGCKDVVLYLIDHGADGRIHPVTKYSPLYIAAYNGKKDIVEILLKRFPELVNTLTVEKWSPLHGACINGHSQILEYLLKFPYPKEFIRTVRDRSGQWEYDIPFDVNLRDINGQTTLYLGCAVGSVKIIDLLLQYKVKARRIDKTSRRKVSRDDTGDEVIQKKPVSRVLALISSKFKGSSEESLGPDEAWISPLDLDLYCNNGTETALHIAVKRREHAIASRLLNVGALPNLIIYTTESVPENADQQQFYFKGSTCLVEACRNRDMGMIDLLLKYGARDDDCKALSVAFGAKDEIIIAKLLALKAHQDPENAINKKGISELFHSHTGPKGFATVGSLAYSSIFPTTSIMINWHEQGSCLTYIKEQWLVDAAVRLNPKLRLSPKYVPTALHAITRLDLSSNQLVEVPSCVFAMQSLKFLSLAQNKIEVLPKSPKSERKPKPRIKEKIYSAPLLEEIQLQDNRLDHLPPALFTLKSLATLDVSNNKLQVLPYEMWKGSKLKELNVSFNLLSELPVAEENFLMRTISNELPPLGSESSYDSDNVSDNTSETIDFDAESTTSDARTIEEKTRLIEQRELKHHSIWAGSVEIQDKSIDAQKDATDDEEPVCSIQTLNLAHNSFSVVPKCLACLAPLLARLNLSYNALAKVGSAQNYPTTLKHLDLSHNQIDLWPGESPISASHDYVCYSESTPSIPSIPENKKISRIQKSTTPRVSACIHRKHTRLESLRTLILADNLLDHIYLYCSEVTSDGASSDDTRSDHPGGTRLLFPILSMLDVSNNRIAEVPANVQELINLSVLNVSGNAGITDLPPQMGLLQKLWNLNTRGCNLQEPLGSMIGSKNYKTSDIIGYLRSVLENSKPYARMKLMVVGIQGIGKTTLLELLRQEGGGSFKRKPVEHWAKRMGNKNINMKTGRGVSISTVGVDIGDWTFERKKTSQGPVVFRTWDFGGQTEYYATHQYFLSKRSLYLVLWKITDGERGMNEIQQWLINIQARAPNSPVVIVGTHFDVVKDDFPPSFSDYLQQKIREKFINVSDPEKCGLPKVLDSIEVSCKTRHNIKLLAHLIYDTAFSLKLPGSKFKLLEQKIPATYLALEDVIGVISNDLRHKGHDPVLNNEQFEALAGHELKQRFNLQFRDRAELSQATKFLHENGLLLHYEDATLKDLYFLDPQWLCDMLSHVVTIREINPFAKNGLMRLDDLKHVFKSSAAVSVTAKSYIVNLLNKFEVALTWDSRTLLIPSLLPTELQMRSGIPGMDMRVKIPVRSRGWGFRGRRGVPQTVAPAVEAKGARSRSVPARMLIKNKEISRPLKHHHPSASRSSNPEYEMTHRSEMEHAIHRLLLMSYFPSGFWSRLLTRILADDSVVEIVRSYFIIPDEISQDPTLGKIFIENKPEWVCWQTGLELQYLETTLFSMKQVLQKVASYYDYHVMKLLLYQEEAWGELDTTYSSILEISLPQDTVVIKRPVKEGSDETIGYQALVLDPNPKSVCQLLALAVEHVDTLLEDWYPSLGTRFLHTSEGKMLVTRLVPCPRCLIAHNERESIRSWQQDWTIVNLMAKHARVSQDSATSDRDSGMGSPRMSKDRDSGMGSPRVSKEGMQVDQQQQDGENDKVYAFLVEECILLAFESKNPHCPTHGDLRLGQIAPDTVFLDLDERLRISSDHIKRGGLIGRGAFGFVYEAACKQRGNPGLRNVALKMLQPIDPGDGARDSTQAAFKAGMSKWERDPLQYSCKAYCTARQELNILLHLKHPHIVPLVGVCTNPLSIVLELAPEGALDRILKHYRRSGDQLTPKCVQLTILQIARALEYLHQQHIIYRDLKSENVLVWHLPPPFTISESTTNIDVHVKLADYGISRPTLPTGAKGFGGTEGFMAPEIVKYNGEEEYTEKVDCFSFGMFIYELLSLHQPFAGHETVKELILDGGRPPLTHRELSYPTYILDLMVVSWSHHPRDRPSTSQLVSIASAPEFIHLMDAIALDDGASCCAADVVTQKQGNELWMACSSGFDEHPVLHVAEVNKFGWQDHVTLRDRIPHNVTSMSRVNDAIWVGDNSGHVHAYDVATYTKLFTYKMEPDAKEEPSPVRAIHFLPNIQKACVAMHNGRMFLCCSDVIPVAEVGGEGTFLITELGSSSCIHSVTSIRNTKGSLEIWCGESHGSISVFTLTDGVVTSQTVINHNDPVVENIEVLQVVSNEPGIHVWTFMYPGCVIYQWDSKHKRIHNKLDCSKLVPCSESLKTIAIDEHFSPGRCQVASLAVQDTKLYVGTSWGCLIIAEALTMRPITVFRPFGDEVQSILSIVPSVDDDESPLVVTVGKGYRPLIARYVTDRARFDSEQEDNSRSLFALVWRPDDFWLTD